MKLLIAVIRPHKLEDVRTALQEVGVRGITVTEVKGYGRQMGHTELYRGAEYTIEFQPKVKLEIAVSAEDSTKAIDAITSAAGSGKVGDGKIFIQDLEQVIRLRTGESGIDAL
jgi:nitrogen regulatory protein PII